MQTKRKPMLKDVIHYRFEKICQKTLRVAASAKKRAKEKKKIYAKKSKKKKIVQKKLFGA